MSEQPRIGFDALFLEQPKTGSGRYALNLWRELRDRLDPSRLALLAPADTTDAVTAEGAGYLASVRTPPLQGRARKLWWEQAGLPAALRSAKPPLDVLHVPYFSAPAVQSVPLVVTIHDLIPLVVPAYRGSFSMRGYMRLVRHTAGRAALILTDSDYSRHEIVRVLGVKRDTVRTIPLAADPRFTPAATDDDRAEIAAVCERLNIQGRYLINTGGLDIRKNVAAVVEGFARASSSSAVDHDLIIVGQAHTGNSNMYPSLDRLIKRLGIGTRVKFVGAPDDDEFIALYRGADFFVFASTYEGFGLTPLEAMACGTPVVSSGATSLEEVVGDAGIVIEPTPGGVAKGIAAMASDAQLRAEFAERGLARAAGYTWRRTADQTLEAYDDVLRGVEA